MRTIRAAQGYCRQEDHIKSGLSKFEARSGHGENWRDYLDLLEARARNKGKRTFTPEEVRRHLGLA